MVDNGLQNGTCENFKSGQTSGRSMGVSNKLYQTLKSSKLLRDQCIVIRHLIKKTS